MRGGTAKLLTLFRPATGEVRAEPVERTPNPVLHGWLRRELAAIVAACPPPPAVPGPGQRWEDWQVTPQPPWWADGLPPLRVLLIWDNLAGHTSWHFTPWLFQHGIMPLYTPLSGSWLNMAESLQRIIVGRALSGQQPQTQAELIAWLEETVAGWNHAPTPFAWDGERRERRGRARQRRLGGSAASATDTQLFAA